MITKRKKQYYSKEETWNFIQQIMEAMKGYLGFDYSASRDPNMPIRIWEGANSKLYILEEKLELLVDKMGYEFNEEVSLRPKAKR